MCQKVREKIHTMVFEYYRANMHRHVACTNVLVCARATLRASLSGTFLQTLPDLATPLKGHSISAQLSTDAVSALGKVWVLVRLWKQPSAQART